MVKKEAQDMETKNVPEHGENSEAGSEIEEKSAKSGKKKLILIVAVLLCISGGGAGYWFLGMGGSEAAAVDKVNKKGVNDKREVVYCEIRDPFIINLRKTSKIEDKSFMKLNVTFEIWGSSSDCDVLLKDMPKIRDTYSLYFTELRKEDLTAVGGGLYSLKEELLRRVMKIVGEKVDVRSVLLSNFVMS